METTMTGYILGLYWGYRDSRKRMETTIGMESIGFPRIC